MNTFDSSTGPDVQPLRLTFSVILAGLTMMLAFGALGGFVTQYFFPEPAPLPNKEQQIVTTVQNITLSPNIHRAEMVEKISKSLVTVAKKTATDITALGAGTILTNDGYIVVLGKSLPADEDPANLAVIDASGAVLPVEIIGRDAAFSLAYLKLSSNVAVPVDVIGQEAPVGSMLTSIDRSLSSSEYVVGSYELQRYSLPAEGSADAWQRVSQGVFSAPATQPGTPLFTEEGKLAAVALDVKDGYALRASDIQESLNRVIAGKHQTNPFETIGIRLQYGFVSPQPATVPVFTATVAAVTPRSPAAVAGIQKGDILKAVANQPVEWKKNISTLLQAPLPLTLITSRQGVERSAIVDAIPPTP